MKHYLFRLGLLLTLAISGVSHALTLGEARVNSFLGQPLDAEIALIGLNDGEHEDLRLRIANDRHFERLGISRDQFLTDLRFDVVRSGEQWLVRVRSTKPVREPFLDFPLQMSWPGGQLVKQYTFLLDPPQRIQAVRAASVNRAAPAMKPRPVAAPTASSMDSYGPVRSGETLWPIAQKLKPSGITTRQMAMALLRANPEAFLDGNVNNLRAGATLSIPPRAFIEELDPDMARAQFAAQSKRWKSAAVSTSPRALEGSSGATAVTTDMQSAAPRAQEPTTPAPAPVESQAQLRIVTDQKQSDTPPGSEQDLKEKLLVTMEEIESNRLTTGAIESRLARLESELERMQQLVELKDAQIAALQSEVSQREAMREEAKQVEPSLPEPAAPPLPTGLQTSEGDRPAPVKAPAPIPVASIEPIAATPAPAPTRPWHEQYLWVIWVVLALLGLAALLLMFRRPQLAPMDIPMANLPELNEPRSARLSNPDTPESSALKEAEEDFRKLSREPLRPAASLGDAAEELPELDISKPAAHSDEIHDGITDSLLDEMLDNNKQLKSSTQSSGPESEFSDDDIASWIKELGAEVERSEPRSANDEKLTSDEDIPSILTELDDQLTSADTTTMPQAPSIQLDPIDEPHEDDTFTMSLDLARAYLEIGDQEGASDMLKQALSGARNPEHRRQIEELLKQIG